MASYNATRGFCLEELKKKMKVKAAEVVFKCMLGPTEQGGQKAVESAPVKCGLKCSAFCLLSLA